VAAVLDIFHEGLDFAPRIWTLSALVRRRAQPLMLSSGKVVRLFFPLFAILWSVGVGLLNSFLVAGFGVF
jgi:hypothetical protein